MMLGDITHDAWRHHTVNSVRCLNESLGHHNMDVMIMTAFTFHDSVYKNKSIGDMLSTKYVYAIPKIMKITV